MSNNFTNTTLLIRYMDNELTAEELAYLEENMARDKNLQEELENLRFARSRVSGLGLRKQVAMMHEEMMNEIKKEDSKPVGIVRSMARISRRVAAGIMMLVLAGAAYQYFTITPGKLFQDNYSPYTIGTTRSANEMSPLEKAFQEKDFETAITLFNNTSNPGPKEYFLAGNAFLAVDDISNAILHFNKCIEKSQSLQSSIYQEDAEYYLAVSYLKNKEVDKALPLFEKMHNQPLHPYHDKISNWFLRKVRVAGWKQ